MADINYSINLRVDKDFLSNSLAATNVTANMAEVGMKSDTYALSGTPVSISTANLSSAGLAFIRNLATATAATCQVGIVSGTSFLAFASPRPGEPAVLRLATGVDYRAIGTAGGRLRVDITEG